MRTKTINILFLVSLVGVLFGVVVVQDVLDKHSDLVFLYNRMLQFDSCLKDGNIPYFYYNDFNRLGYGSSFFYGQLLFWVLRPFAGEFRSFLTIYLTISITLIFYGSSYLAKRFTKNNWLIAYIYTFSPMWCSAFLLGGMYPLYMAHGLSLLFIGCCVDFFRDNKSFLPAGVLFFIVLNTHTLSALIAFSLCVLLFIYYFKWCRLKSYFEFAVYCVILCLYTLVNGFYHKGALSSMEGTTLAMLEYYKTRQSVFYLNPSILKPFGGEAGFHLLDVVTFMLCLYTCKPSKKVYRSLALVGLGCLVMCPFGWYWFIRLTKLPLQFPIRISGWFVLLFLLTTLRGRLKKQVKLLLVVVPFLFSIFFGFNVIPSDKLANHPTPLLQVMNGEYLSKEFRNGLPWYETVELPNSHDFILDSNKTYTLVHNQKRVLFPKMYYRGYKAFHKGQELSVSLGYSQLCEVDTSGVSGLVTLVYVHPIWLKALGFICYTIFLISLFIIVSDYFIRRVLPGDKEV